MGVSKVTLNGTPLMDVTEMTVDEDNLLYGETALRNNGNQVTGAVVTAPASDVDPSMDGVASAGSASTYSRGDHVHPTDTSRAPLASPALTGTPTAPTASTGTNTTQIATTAFVNASISALGSVLNYKGTKATESALPSTGNTTGDVWIVTADNSEYVWNGTAWEKLGPTIDLSGYVPTTRTVNNKALSSDITLTASDVGALPDSTTIPQGTVTSVRVQATSPVSSSTSTAQSTTLNTTISLADAYGDTKNPYGTKTKNYVLAGPTTGSAAAPSFRALVADDIPSITKSKISDFPAIPSKTSDLTNDSGFITSSDIPVTSVNSKTGAVSLSASDVGALADSTDVTKWNGVALNKNLYANSESYVLPFVSSTSATEANYVAANATPNAKHVAVFDSNAMLKSTTPAAGDNSTNVATTAYVDSAISNVDALPSQTGQSGKFLTTDGSDASWATADALPSQTGNSGKFLTTNGSAASWADVTIPTYTLSMSGNRITLTPSSGTASYVDLPVYSGAVV